MQNERRIGRIITEAIEELERLQTVMPDEFRKAAAVPPVLWFGDICSEKPKVLVVSANPNRPDLPEDNPRISYCREWKKGGRDIQELETDYNQYFFHNPATNWFGRNPRLEKEDGQQGRIEDFLNGLDASFYGEAKYQAIHIDLLPFSTETTFTEIATEIMAIDGLTQWINNHLRQMVDVIKPQMIIVNGSTNFDYFNLCVNLGAQPYQIHKFNNSIIWRSAHHPDVPQVIGISTNMGSYCRKTRKELQELGKYIQLI